jgi:MFS family permease
VLLAGVAGGIAFPILPVVGAKAGLSLGFIGAILAANRIGRIVASPLVGAFADRVGGRRLLLGGLALQVLIMGLFALGVMTGAPGPFFLLGRALHGPGSAGVYVAGQALALHAGGISHARLSTGTVRAAMSVGLPLGLVAGGLLSARFGFAVTFELAGVACVAALAAAFTMVPDIRANVSRPASLRDSVETVRDLRLAALGALNFIVSLLAGGLVLTTLVLTVKARALTLLGMTEELTASLAMGLMVVVMGIATLVASRAATGRRAHASVALGSTVLLIPGLALIGAVPGLWGLVLGVTLLGIGAGGLGSALLALLGELVPQDRRGTAVGWTQLCGDVGGSVGPVLGTLLLAHGTARPYLVGAALAILFVPVAVWLRRKLERDD